MESFKLQFDMFFCQGLAEIGFLQKKAFKFAHFADPSGEFFVLLWSRVMHAYHTVCCIQRLQWRHIIA